MDKKQSGGLAVVKPLKKRKYDAATPYIEQHLVQNAGR